MGHWEHEEITKRLYLHSGVYTYLKPGDKEITKTRGMNPDNSDKQEYETMRDLLINGALAAWQKPADPLDKNTWPEVSFMQREFVTAGNSVAGEERFKLIGRWAKKPRIVNVHEAGLKRRHIKVLPHLRTLIRPRVCQANQSGLRTAKSFLRVSLPARKNGTGSTCRKLSRHCKTGVKRRGYSA